MEGIYWEGCMTEQFEAWFKRQPDSEYCGAHIKALLQECWQASRQDIVVKLPPYMKGIDETCRVNNKAIDMLCEILHPVGVRYE
jgi:phage-related protein